MKILLLGDYSAVHKNLKEGLCSLGHEVDFASNGDGWKKIPRDIAFGDYSDVFNFGIKEYIDNHSYNGDIKELFTNLIETGSYKIGNIKKFQDLQSLL